MIADFRRRFWVSLVLTIPILVLSPLIQSFLGIEGLIAFPGDSYLVFVLASGVYFYGGWPFLKGLITELAQHQPAMMTLIALAITVGYVYSSAVVFGVAGPRGTTPSLSHWRRAWPTPPGQCCRRRPGRR